MPQRRQTALPQKRDLDWDFFAFPTFFGVAAGALLAFFLAIIAPFAFFYFFLIALFAFTFAVSHILMTGTRMRRDRQRKAREEEQEIERRILARRQMEDAHGVSSRRARRRRKG